MRYCAIRMNPAFHIRFKEKTLVLLPHSDIFTELNLSRLTSQKFYSGYQHLLVGAEVFSFTLQFELDFKRALEHRNHDRGYLLRFLNNLFI